MLQQNLSNLPPSSLAWDRVIVEPKPGVEENFFLRTLLKIGGYYSKESQQIQGAKAWYNAVTEQVENPAIYEGAVNSEPITLEGSLRFCTTRSCILENKASVLTYVHAK